MIEQAIHAVVGHPVQHVSQIDLVPLFRAKVGNGIHGRQRRRPLITTSPHEEIAAGTASQNVVALAPPEHVIPLASQEPIISTGTKQPVTLIRALQVMAALTVDDDRIGRGTDDSATHTGLCTQGQGVISHRQILEIDRHGLIHRQ